MQTIVIDGTTYTVKFDRDPLELAKAARKPYRPKRPKDIRKFPRDTGRPVSTAEYIRQFEALNNLVPVQYENLNVTGTAQYDSTIPLLEEIDNG